MFFQPGLNGSLQPCVVRKLVERVYGTKAASNATAKANVPTKDR